MQRLYLAIAVPKITYAADVWYMPPQKPEGRKKSTGSVFTLQELTKVQRIALLAITGGLRTTPTDILDTHADLLPMDLVLLKSCHQAFLCICALPETHPLHEIVGNLHNHPQCKHASAIQNLLQIFPTVNPHRIEPIAPTRWLPGYTKAFTTEIAPTRIESMVNKELDNAEIRVYTDGSAINEQVGATAILYRKGREHPEKVLRYRLGSNTEHTLYEGEVVGAILGAWLLCTEHIAGILPVSMYTDSQALIQETASKAAKLAHYLVEEFIALSKNINHTSMPAQRTKFNFRWISGHTEVEGNEAVDEEAKKAAKGQCTPPHMLPPILHSLLPTSVSAAKQQFTKAMKDKWRNIWAASP